MQFAHAMGTQDLHQQDGLRLVPLQWVFKMIQVESEGVRSASHINGVKPNCMARAIDVTTRRWERQPVYFAVVPERSKA